VDIPPVPLNLNLQSDLENYTVACYVSNFCSLCGKRIKNCTHNTLEFASRKPLIEFLWNDVCFSRWLCVLLQLACLWDKTRCVSLSLDFMVAAFHPMADSCRRQSSDNIRNTLRYWYLLTYTVYTEGIAGSDNAVY